MSEIAAALLVLEMAVVCWVLLRTRGPSLRQATPPAAAILDRRHAVRAELDALLGTEEADLLLCGMARHEGHPVFDLALLERALASAKALSGRTAAPRSEYRSQRAAADQQIEIPLPPSLIGQWAPREARHG